ncbi:MAG: DUF4337 domain-containing protein [Burkholderiaceae bacterium]
MSDDAIHEHGPHDHELEHAAQHGGDSFASRVAVTTAVLATAGAIFGYQAGATQNDAAMFKNNAAIKKTEASNQWNYYQAKSNRQNLAELAQSLPGVDAARYQADAARYRNEKEQIRQGAEKLEAESRAWDDRSEGMMHRHHRWAMASTAEQIAIALAAIALLTRKRWLQVGVYGVAALGIGIGVTAWLH